jgi:hypothetical protein
MIADHALGSRGLSYVSSLIHLAVAFSKMRQ